MEHKNVGNHVEDLADGRMLAPGETVELTEEEAADPHNADKIDRGILLALDQEAKATDSAKELAAEKGVSLNAVTGTGRGGQITQDDVEKYVRDNEGEAS